MGVRLYNTETGSMIGTASDEDMQFLVDNLEEESSSDTDYFIDSDTVDMLEESGASASLVGILRAEVATSEGFEMRWETYR
ncbi:MAG: galactosyldiacylglycerol synthase [Candidatus Schekmanbacteria bacterium]|nr:galactosyldiacylglycerol synthase [Candidatus Schekmanbacteria bacterium]